jgi:hypothetical protein
MDKVLLIYHNADMVSVPDFKEDQISRQNLLSRYFIARPIQLLRCHGHIQAGLPVHIMHETAAVKGIRTFCPTTIGLSQKQHCVLDDIFPNLAARLVDRYLLGAASEQNGKGQEKEKPFYQ